MAALVDACILETVEASTEIDFEEEEVAEERLRLSARMKGRGVKKLIDLRIPAFMGALLGILPRCIDIAEENGEVTKGYYNQHLTKKSGKEHTTTTST